MINFETVFIWSQEIVRTTLLLWSVSCTICCWATKFFRFSLWQSDSDNRLTVTPSMMCLGVHKWFVRLELLQKLKERGWCESCVFIELPASSDWQIFNFPSTLDGFNYRTCHSRFSLSIYLSYIAKVRGASTHIITFDIWNTKMFEKLKRWNISFKSEFKSIKIFTFDIFRWIV